jgi:hypothetical protein
MVVDLYGFFFFVIENLKDGHKLADCPQVIQKHKLEKVQLSVQSGYIVNQ